MSTKKAKVTAKAAAAGAKKPRGPTKSELFKEIGEMVSIPKSKVDEVFDALGTVIGKYLRAEPHSLTVAGLMKITRVDKPALGARQVRNPKTGEMMMAKPKPASKAVRLRALKQLKDLAL